MRVGLGQPGGPGGTTDIPAARYRVMIATPALRAVAVRAHAERGDAVLGVNTHDPTERLGVIGEYPFLDHAGPLAFAHRGGAAEGLENSLVAFSSAVTLGFRYLETDLHATRDGVLLAFHDRRLKRVTDRGGRVSRLRYRQVVEARIGGTEPIPRFVDLLNAFPTARFNVDVKELNAVMPLAAVLREHDAVDRVCVASFSDRRLIAVRAAVGPRLCTALGPHEAYRLWRFSRRPNGRSPVLPPGALCVQVPPRVGRMTVVDRRFVATAHDAGLVVHVWTINAAAEMHRLFDMGVDGIMTDRPAVLRAVLADRGMWVS